MLKGEGEYCQHLFVFPFRTIFSEFWLMHIFYQWRTNVYGAFKISTLIRCVQIDEQRHFLKHENWSLKGTHAQWS